MIRRERPDRVVTQSPVRNLDRIYASHPDHLAVGEACLSAVYPDARNEFAFPELAADDGLAPHTVSEVWLMGGPEPDHHVDITDAFDRKVEALLCHASQLHEPERMPAFLREWAEASAKAAGLGEGRCAESFRRVVTT